MKRHNFFIWMSLALAVTALVCGFGQGRALAQSLPPCNSTIGITTNCTDYFGVANYANSPLPAGPVDITPLTGFTIVNGGSGYLNGTSGSLPATITDFYGTPGAVGAIVTATVTNGVITAITGGSGGSGYVAPVVTITDATGTGAIILAKLSPVGTTGGMRKFVNTDTLPDLKAVLAVPDTITFPGSDYYVIALTQYSQKMHIDLPATTLRGYVQLNNGTNPATGLNTVVPPAQSYLGPVILAQKDRPVRVLFKNQLPLTSGTPSGNLFIPVDTTYMGAGMGPDGTPYLQNRATLHLHGGNTPWISDGTPHQWTVPAGDFAATTHQRGVSTQFVPDMWFDAAGNIVAAGTLGATNDPGNGSMSFYWTNQQGGRLMFYHDHAYGITRLNVYAGEAAGYLLFDPAEEAALAAATVPGTIAAGDLAHLIPLVIQDKTFVPSAAQLAGEDPTWTVIPGGGTIPGTANVGDLWFPHVYTPNQNPADMGGANAFGRWDYGPWFFPPQTSLTAAIPPTAVTVPCTSAAFPGQLLTPTAANNYLEGCPIIPNPSGTPEAFMDTPLVNGKAYPVLHVAPAAYRFQILSAGNDRTLNLSLFQACGSAGYIPGLNVTCPSTAGTEVPMVTAAPNLGLPPTWPTDGRDGGVPDPLAAGPPFIQIGSEGGLLPKVAVIPPAPIVYEYNRRSITVLNVFTHALMLGPAERADVIVDFTGRSGQTLILYNDAPAPVPAFDPRIDYYTGDPDQVATGGAPTTLPGYGPNTRTIMQIVVDQSLPNTIPFNLATLQAQLSGIYSNSTMPMQAIVPEPTYPVASGGNSATATYARISDNTITYTPIGETTPVTLTYEQKAIQELFTLDYGRMNATLGTELPLTNFLVQTTLPFGYAEWPTEIIQDSLNNPTVPPQLWKLTHNGVDTHFIHFHLFNVQVINRIGWDGAVKPPDPNELGWKDTVRMNPLEDIVVALKPMSQTGLPFPLPDSIRSLDVTMPDGFNPDPTMSGIDPATGNAILNAPIGTTNALVNFGWEYVWHCHILGHEENDMMRPIVFQVPPPAPSNLVAANDANIPGQVNLSWKDNSANETGFTVQRDINPAFPNSTILPLVGPSTPTNAVSQGTSWGGPITITDSPGIGTFYYRVRAEDNALLPSSPLTGIFQALPLSSAWSNTAATGLFLQTVTFTGAPASAVYNSTFTVTTTTNAPVTPTITGTGACVFGPVTAISALITMTSGTGTCTLTATWPATGTFAPATATQTTAAVLATPTITWPTPSPIPYGTPLSGTQLNATATYNGSPVPGTFAYTPPAGTVLNAGSQTLSVIFTPNATANYASAAAAVTLVVTKDNSTTTITPPTPTPNPSVVGQSVTVNFSVASAVALTGGASGPTGTVTVTGNGSSCTGTLTPGLGPGSGTGSGSCSLTFATAGAKTLTATYNGDANFNTSASAGVTQQVRDFSIIYKAPTSQSVNGNQKATYTVTLSSLNGFAGTVALSCGGNYPSSFSCSVAPSSVTLTAGGSSNATVTVNTTRGFPGTYNVTTTGVFNGGVPATGGLTHSATATLTTKN
jgi:FtsP/CotA-like multicopper oxidase with cupredoxin domain